MRRRLSKINDPAEEVEKDDTDAKSDDSNRDEAFWADGSPLGIGPQADDWSLNSGVFESFSVDDSSLEEEDDENDDDDEIFYDEDGNRRQPYLWEQVKKKSVKAVFTSPSAEAQKESIAPNERETTPVLASAGSISSSDTPPISRQNSVGTSSVPSVSRTNSGGGDGKTPPEKRARRTSKRNSTTSVTSNGDVSSKTVKEGSVGGKSAGGRSQSISTTRVSPAGTPVDDQSISRSSSKQMPISRSIGPSFDISDSGDEEDEADFKRVEGGGSLPLNLLSMLQGGTIECAERGSNSDRSSVTANSDAERASDYLPISAVAVSFAKNTTAPPLASGRYNSQGEAVAHEDLGPDGGKAVLVGGIWELHPHRRSMIAPQITAAASPISKVPVVVVPEEPVGDAGASLSSSLSEMLSVTKATPAQVKTPKSVGKKNKKCVRQPIEVRGVSPDPNLRSMVEPLDKDDEEVEKGPIDETKWRNELFAGIKGGLDARCVLMTLNSHLN
jgi:hypothetical protein